MRCQLGRLHDKGPDSDIWLPSRTAAVALYDEYRNNGNFILRVTYEPHVRQTITDIYDSLASGQRPRLGSAALLLSICAMAAFLWTPSTSSSSASDLAQRPSLFPDEEAAVQAFRLWRRHVWTLLDRTWRDSTPTLESIQANMILGDIFYSTEGCSTRMRHLHACAVSDARELCLHLVDIGTSSRREPAVDEDPVTKEIQRRVWWFITSTDWYASCPLPFPQYHA